MASPRSDSRGLTSVDLSADQHRFLEDLIKRVRERTGIKFSVSDVFRSLLDSAMIWDLDKVDVDRAYGKARVLSALLATRRTLEREIRQTESDLHQALVHSPDEPEVVRNFRRNLRYQSSRMSALMEQLEQCRSHENGNGNGAEQIVQTLLIRHLETG